MRPDPRSPLLRLGIADALGRAGKRSSRPVEPVEPAVRHALLALLAMLATGLFVWTAVHPIVEDGLITLVICGVAVAVLAPAISQLAYQSPRYAPRSKHMPARRP